MLQSANEGILQEQRKTNELIKIIIDELREMNRKLDKIYLGGR